MRKRSSKSHCICRSHLQGMHLSRTSNTPGSYEAATPSGLGATGASYSPMSSPAMLLTNRSVNSLFPLIARICQNILGNTVFIRNFFPSRPGDFITISNQYNFLHYIRNVKFLNESFYNMRCLVMFITAVCLIFFLHYIYCPTLFVRRSLHRPKLTKSFTISLFRSFLHL